ASVRLSHEEPGNGTLQVKKAKSPERVTVPAGTFEVVRWDLEMVWGEKGSQKQKRTVWVEKAWPRRIIAWEGQSAGLGGKNEPTPERGELTGSIRNTYWQHNAVKDEALRKQ